MPCHTAVTPPEMKPFSFKAWVLMSAVVLGCGTDDQSPADSGGEAADSNVPSVSDAPANPSNEASTDDAGATSDVGAADDSAGDGEADRDAVGSGFDAGDSDAPLDATGATDAAHGASCQDATDCQIFSSQCGGCNCLALRKTDPDPVCAGHQVQCFTDPCQGHTAGCDQGHCVVQ